MPLGCFVATVEPHGAQLWFPGGEQMLTGALFFLNTAQCTEHSVPEIGGVAWVSWAGLTMSGSVRQMVRA